MNYHNKILKSAVIMLAAVVLLGTAGAVSAAEVGNLTFNLSTGEITQTGTSYTGYIEFEPNAEFKLNAFRFVISSDDSDVTFAESKKTDALFADNTKFTYSPLNSGKSIYAITGTLEGGDANVTLNPHEKVKIAPVSIHVNSTVTNETVNASFVHDAMKCYVTEYKNGVSTVYKLGVDVLIGNTYPLNNATANSIKPESLVYADIETNGTIFDGNVSVFSELTKKIANSSSEYFLNYTSSKEDVVKFYNYDNATWNMTPQYVVLKGTNSSVITVNLTNNETGAVIDSKQFTVNTKKITLGADAFNFTDNHTYGYKEGVSVGPQVLEDVKQALLNHSVGAADVGEEAYDNGYVRQTGKITLTFFNDTACKNEVVPIEGGVYYFNVSIAGNDNYYEVVDLQIANNSFAIDGAVIRGVCIPLNKSYFNATTNAKMTVEFNATGMDFNTSVFDRNTTVSEYIYFNAHYNLSFNQSASNYTVDNVNVSLLDGNRTISFATEKIKPDHVVTYFVFEGFPRGDVSLDGEVFANDASLLAADYANHVTDQGFLTQEQLFYGNVKGSEKITLNDVRLIAQYAAGYLDADYEDIRSQP